MGLLRDLQRKPWLGRSGAALSRGSPDRFFLRGPTRAGKHRLERRDFVPLRQGVEGNVHMEGGLQKDADQKRYANEVRRLT